MTRDRLLDLILSTLEFGNSRVVIQLPNNEIGLVRGVTSAHGEIVIQVTMDARDELQ